jgi:hypothetical protein
MEFFNFSYRVWMSGYAIIFLVPVRDTEESPLFFYELSGSPVQHSSRVISQMFIG